uniref:Uncharacterized protein n=1 Tax=Ixodes ricinus TaxID=34613 RepID=A0A0K8RBH8_IXORI
MTAQAATSKVQEALNTPFDFRMIGSETAPASTQIIFKYSSSPKSAMSLAFWSQGFQTTVSGKFFLIIFTVEPFSLQECFSPVLLIHPRHVVSPRSATTELTVRRLRTYFFLLFYLLLPLTSTS